MLTNYDTDKIPEEEEKREKYKEYSDMKRSTKRRYFNVGDIVLFRQQKETR